MEKMYPPVVNSPKTELAELITDTQTEITVANASVLLPGEGIAVLGNGDVAETITYTSVEDNVLKGCVRGFEGVARAWPVGTRVARNFTASAFRSVQKNMVR
ncbi:phage tail protein, partial [Paenibacillus sp. 28ISP30-2]|nr:phage tail protein [Paenibacillus sp. 28ISP30-2]